MEFEYFFDIFSVVGASILLLVTLGTFFMAWKGTRIKFVLTVTALMIVRLVCLLT